MVLKMGVSIRKTKVILHMRKSKKAELMKKYNTYYACFNVHNYIE